MRSDRGQAMVLLLAAVAMAVLVIIGVGQMGRRLSVHAGAQTAADAAALAGVSGGREWAARTAARNGAHLVRFERIVGQHGATVTVVVEVGNVQVTGRATNGP